MIRVEIDGNTVTSREDLHEIFSRQLNFPAWYGKNLDALFDCLTEPGEEVLFTLRNPEALEERLGGYAKTFLKVLKDAEQMGNRFHFTISG